MNNVTVEISLTVISGILVALPKISILLDVVSGQQHNAGKLATVLISSQLRNKTIIENHRLRRRQREDLMPVFHLANLFARTSKKRM